MSLHVTFVAEAGSVRHLDSMISAITRSRIDAIFQVIHTEIEHFRFLDPTFVYHFPGVNCTRVSAMESITSVACSNPFATFAFFFSSLLFCEDGAREVLVRTIAATSHIRFQIARATLPHVLFRISLSRILGSSFYAPRLRRILDSFEVMKVEVSIAHELSFRRLSLPFIDQALYLSSSI